MDDDHIPPGSDDGGASQEPAAAVTPPADDQELEITAIHEAGHVVFALAVGIAVESATIKPEGNTLGCVVTKPLPIPTQAMCTPGSPWIDIRVKKSLAGDRAVRVARPLRETAGGDQESDYAVANDYLDAVYPSKEVEPQLDRLCFELDAFFRAPLIETSVRAVTKLLLEKRTVTGMELTQVVNGDDRRCGAFWPDFSRRCTVAAHPFFASHISHDHRSPPVFWDPLMWSEDRTPRHKRSSAWKRVVRVHAPHLLPPPPRRVTYADLPQLKADAMNPRLSARERQAADRKVLSLIATRIREASVTHSLPRPEDQSNEAVGEILQRHLEECGSEPQRTDRDYWCEECGFEYATAPSGRRKRWVYLVLDYRKVREIQPDGTESAPKWMATPGLSFPTADEARTYLRLVSTTEASCPMSVRRIPR